MVGGSVRGNFEIARLVFLNVRERIDNHQQADSHYTREYDCESLAHRDLVSGLQRFTVARAKILPVVWSYLREAIPVSFKTFRESFEWRVKLRNITDRSQIV